MSPMAKREYLAAMRRRYRYARGRREKTRFLDEICATTGYDRKYVIRALSGRRKSGRKGRGQRGRKTVYGTQLVAPLKKIWLTANLPCGKRLKAMIPLWLPGYERLYGELEGEVRDKLVKMSSSTMVSVTIGVPSKSD